VILGLVVPWATIGAGSMVSSLLGIALDIPIAATTINATSAFGIALGGGIALIAATVAATRQRAALIAGGALVLGGVIAGASALITIDGARSATAAAEWVSGIADVSQFVAIQTTAAPLLVMVGSAALLVGGLLTALATRAHDQDPIAGSAAPR